MLVLMLVVSVVSNWQENDLVTTKLKISLEKTVTE